MSKKIEICMRSAWHEVGMKRVETYSVLFLNTSASEVDTFLPWHIYFLQSFVLFL